VKLLFATTNQGKLTEAKKILRPHQVISLGQIKNRNGHALDQMDVAETGTTLKENAFIKAKFYGEKSDFITVADDTGLKVDALDGQPGVNSHRWHPGSDHERNLALLERLKGKSDRTAQFVTVICLYQPDNHQTYFFQGVVEGKISLAEKGNQGFGYDPIFIPQGYEKSFAQLGLKEKNKLSHRARALKKLKQFLSQTDFTL
jgi:XTP/dITP diphosphohydrolase